MKMYVVYVLKHFASIQAADIANEKRLRSHLLGALLPYSHTEEAQEVLMGVGKEGIEDLRRGKNQQKNKDLIKGLDHILKQNVEQGGRKVSEAENPSPSPNPNLDPNPTWRPRKRRVPTRLRNGG